MAVYTDVSDEELAAFLVEYTIGEGGSCKGIAEGIETREDLEILRDLGVDFGQGFLLGRPQDAAIQ